MKKSILTLFILLLSYEAYSQTVSLQLASAPGVYINNYTGTNIKFRRSPYTSGDVISGLTVTHPTGNTIGNYEVSGFTTFELARLYINDVYQEWWGTKYVGNPNNAFVHLTGNEDIAGNKTFSGVVIIAYPYVDTDSPLYTNYAHSEFYASTLIWKKYVEDLYGRLASSNVWTGATNQFEAGLFHDIVTFEDVVTGMDFEMDNASDLYLWVTPPSNTTLVWKRLADSTYGVKKWWVDGFKIRLLTGYKWYGVNSGTPPIKIDETDLTYTDETIGLGVGTTQDSTAFHEAVSIYYDSTDASENNYRKVYTDYIPNYKNPVWDSIGTKTKYQRITNGSVVSEAEYYKANNAYFKELELLTGLTTTDQIVDTLTLPRPGLYMITSVFTVNFVDHNGASTDSIIVSIDDGSLPGSSRLASQTVTHRYESLVTSGGAMTVTVTCLFYRQGNNNPIYLMAHNHQSGSSLIHEVWKTQTTAVNIY